MRIGILSPTYPPNAVPCGVGDFTKMLAPRLAETGLEVRVFAGAGYTGPGEEGGVRVRKIPGGWGPASLGRIARASREEGIGALLVQYAPNLYPPAGRWIHFLPAAMRLFAPGIPSVFSMHTVGVSTLASKAGAALMLASAPAILSTNEEVTHLIGKYMRKSPRKLREVPIGANIEPPPGGAGGREAARRRVREEAGLGPEDWVLAHFGFYYPGKGTEEIIGAAARWKEEGRRFRLFMAGGRWPDDGGFYPALKERAEAAGLGEELIWTGYVGGERISEILLAADLFLAPFAGGISSRRGSLMAALAHGLPVVSTPPQAPTKYFREGENFFPVPFGDAGALAAAAAALMADPGRRARLAEGASALAEIFSWPAIALRTRDFLEDVMDRGPLARPGA